MCTCMVMQINLVVVVCLGGGCPTLGQSFFLLPVLTSGRVHLD